MDCSPEAQHYLIFCYEWSLVHYYNCSNWSFLITIFAYEMSSIYWVSLGCCFSHSMCFVTYLWNLYERGTSTSGVICSSCFSKEAFQGNCLSVKFSAFTLYTPKMLQYALSFLFFLLGILLLVALGIPHSQYWFEIYSCEIKCC